MADEIARLVAVMEAQLRGFTKGMDQAQKIADQKFGQIERRMAKTESKFSNAFSGLGNKLLGGAALVGIERFVSNVVSSASKIKDTADTIGISTDALQSWGLLAAQAGVNQDAFNGALEKFAKNLGEAQIKGGDLAKIFKDLGVDIHAGTEAAFLQLADGIAKTGNQEQRVKLTTEAISKAAAGLTPVLQQSSDAINAQTEAFRRNGQIMTTETLDKLDKLDDKWEALKKRLTSIGGTFLSGFAGELTDFIDQVNSPDLAANVRSFGAALGEVGKALAFLSPFLPEITGALIGLRVAGPVGGLVGGITGGVAAGIADIKKSLAQGPQTSVDLALKPFPKPPPSGGIDRSGLLQRDEAQKAVAKSAADAAQAEFELAKAEDAANANILEGTLSRFAAQRKQIQDNATAEITAIDEERKARIASLEETKLGQKAYAETINNINTEYAARESATIVELRAKRLESARDEIEARYDVQRGIDEQRRETIRSQSGYLLELSKGTKDYFKVLHEVTEEDARLQEESVKDRLDHELSYYERAKELAEKNGVDYATYEEDRKSATEKAELEITAIRQNAATQRARISEEETHALEHQIQVMDRIRGGLEDVGLAALDGSKSFKEAVANMLQDIAKLILRLYVIRPLIESILGPAGTTGGGLLGSIFGSLFGAPPLLGPAIPSGVVITPRVRASGGPVKKDEPYLVGEQGKELFVPDISGFIIPNKKTEEILRTQDGRAAGGPVSKDKPYVVGETGRELFIPSTSGFVYRKEPDGKGGTRDTGRMVFAGQPIVVGDVGVEVFVPDFPEQKTQTESNTAHTARTDIINEHQKDLFAPDVAEHIQQLQSLVQPAPQASNIDGRRSEPSPDVRANERADEPLPQSPKHVKPQIQHEVAPSNIHVDVPVSEHSIIERSKLIADALRTRDALRTHDATIINDATKEAIERVRQLDHRVSDVTAQSSSELHTNREFAGSVPVTIHTVDHLSDVTRDDRVSHTHSKELHAGADRQMDRETIKAQRGSQSHTYVVGDHGEELFIPNVAGFIYPRAVPEKGTRDIARVLSAGQPIIVGQRGEEIFAPYISHEAILREAPNAQRVPSIGPAVAAERPNSANAQPQPTVDSPFPVRVIESPSNAQYTQEREAKSDEHDAENLRAKVGASKATKEEVTPAWVAVSNEAYPVHHELNTSASSANTTSAATSFANAYSHYRKSAPFGEAIINLRRERTPDPDGGQEAVHTEMHSVRPEERAIYAHGGILVQKGPLPLAGDYPISGHPYPAQAMGIHEPIHGQVTPEHPDTQIQAHHASPRASGGPVSPGYMYIVGEHGREMFTPSSMGNYGPEVKRFALGGILGGLIGDFGGQSSSFGAFGLLKLLGLGGGGALGIASQAGLGTGAFDLLDWLKHHFAQGGVMGPEGEIPLQKFGFGGMLGGLLGDFGGQSSNLGAFGVLKMLGLGGAASGLFGMSQSQGLGAFGLVDWLKDRFAEGGIMGPHGRIPIHSFASGGIANSPQLALFGEGSGPEAFVPLQGGKIPVRLQIPNISTPVISGGSSSNSIYVDARGAQVGVAEQIQQALTRAFPTFVGAAVNTVDKNFPSMFRKAHRDRL